MNETTKTGIEAYIEDDAVLTGMERYEEAVYLLSEIMGCGTGDTNAIIDMIRTHDDLIEATREYIDEVGIGW